MGLFDWLSGLGHEDAIHRTQIRIAPERVLTGAKVAVSPVAEQHYVRLWLTEMFLRDGGRWFTSRYPLTYSLVSLDFGDQKGAEWANVSGKNKLDIKQTDLGRSLLYNYPMTPLLPFRGGTISLDCGLVSMAADNIIKSFASVVSEFAGKLGDAQVSAVAGIAASVAGSVQELLGAGDSVSKLYYHDVFAAGGGTKLTSGYLFLSEAAEGTIDPRSLWVTPSGIRQGASAADARALEPQDYLLLQIECATERDDYRSFSFIADPFNDALAAKSDGDADKARLLIAQAKRAVQKSVAFTAADGKRIRLAIDAAFAADGWEAPALEGAVGLIGKAAALTPLEVAINRLSLAKAATMNDPGED